MAIPQITLEDDDFFIQFDKGIVWRKFNWMNKKQIPYWRKVDYKDSKGYIRFDYKGYKSIKLHRFLYEKFYGIKLNQKQHIDHKNHIRDDNRITNLKLTDSQGNNQNCSKRKQTSSKYIGVCWRKRDKKWRARIQNPSTNKREYLGSFDNEKEAAMAYINKAEQLNKIYNANFNIPYLKSLLED